MHLENDRNSGVKSAWPDSSLSTVEDSLVLCSSFILSLWFSRTNSAFFSSNWASNLWMRSSAEPCRSCACNITGSSKIPITYKTQIQQERIASKTGSVNETRPRNVIRRLIFKTTLLQYNEISSNQWQVLMKNLHYLTGLHIVVSIPHFKY
jgi:hypothetical protein